MAPFPRFSPVLNLFGPNSPELSKERGFSRDWGEEWCPWRLPSHRRQLVWGAWGLQLDLVLASLVVVGMVARQHLPLIVGTKVVGKDGVWRRRAFARVPRVCRCAWAGALAWVEITWKFTGCWNWENLPTSVKNKVPASMGCVSWAEDSLSGSWPAACPQVPAVPSLSAHVPAVPSWPPRIWRTRSTRATWSWYWSKAFSSSRMCWVLIKVVVKVVRVFLTEALLARSFPSATRQRIAIVLTRPG